MSDGCNATMIDQHNPATNPECIYSERTTGHAWVDGVCSACGKEGVVAQWAEPCPALRRTMTTEDPDAENRETHAVCLRCGVPVVELDIHNEWHRSLGFGK